MLANRLKFADKYKFMLSSARMPGIEVDVPIALANVSIRRQVKLNLN